MESCRLVFGEADLLVELLKEELEQLGYSIRGVYERSDAKVRTQEGMERIKGFYVKVERCLIALPIQDPLH